MNKPIRSLLTVLTVIFLIALPSYFYFEYQTKRNQVDLRWSGSSLTVRTQTGVVVITHMMSYKDSICRIAELSPPLVIPDSGIVDIDYSTMIWKDVNGVVAAPRPGERVTAVYSRPNLTSTSPG